MLLLLLILILGTTLRFFHLSQEALWTDEMVTLLHIETGNVHDLVISIIDKELTPPGHALLLFYWVKVFDKSEFALRFISVISDIASILLVFLLGSRLFNRKTGLLAAFITAITMLQVVYAQEARPYALLGFLVLLSTYLFTLYYQKKHNKYLIPYTIASLAAIYVGYMAFFIIGFHFLLLIFTKRISKQYLFSLIGICMGFFIGWQILYYQVLLRHPLLQEGLVYRGVPQFLSDLGVGFYLLPILLLSFGILLFYYLFKKYQHSFSIKKIATYIIIFSLISAVLHLIFLSTTLRSFALIRHSFFMVPFIYIILAWAILQKPKALQKILIFIILLFSIYTLSTYYTSTTKAPWPEAIDYMKENSPQDTKVFFDRPGSNNYLFDYYGGEYFQQLNLTGQNEKMISDDKFEQMISKEKTFWLVSSRNVRNNYLDSMQKHDLLMQKEYPELTVSLYS